MEKKNKYLKLCLDPELERKSRITRRRAIILSVAISVLAVIALGIVIFFLK